MTISPIYNSQLYILRYTTKAKLENEPFCQTRKINIQIKFYLFCRTHAFEHHRYIVEFYITKLSIQCSLPMCQNSGHKRRKCVFLSVAEVRFGPVQHHFLLNLEPEPTTEGR